MIRRGGRVGQAGAAAEYLPLTSSERLNSQIPNLSFNGYTHSR